MFLWSSWLDLLRVLLFALAHVCGGSLGSGIVVLSLMVRLALMPLTYRLALRAWEHQAVLLCIRPQLEVLRKQHAGNPATLARATGELHAANGVGLVPKGTFLGAIIQMPIGAGVYQVLAGIARGAARFLWVADLGRPDALVASLAAGLAGAAVIAGPSTPSSRTTAGLAAVVTFLIAWRLSAGVALYWVSSNVVNVVQSLLVRRAVAEQA